MNLTENEKRDIIKYLESGKPLPEKYRFLLFADKKEVELVWNGKTSEVTNVVLPFQTIEVVDEPRAENTKDTKKQAQQKRPDGRVGCKFIVSEEIIMPASAKQKENKLAPKLRFLIFCNELKLKNCFSY